MINPDNADIESENRDNYDDLVGTIEASQGILALLIAVCDNSDFRDEIINRYEAELQPEIRPYRLKLARGEPSLRAAIAEVVKQDEYLQQGGKAVLTVTGTEQLFFLKLGAERSEQEIFFGYLQWTREGLREFPYPIVLWVTQQMLVNLSKKAPDFWSWRKGVFRFQSRKVGVVPSREIEDFHPFLKEDLPAEDESYLLPLEDLQQLIQHIERERGAKDPILVSLYASMGRIYYWRLQEGKDLGYQREQALAIEYFSKAIELEKELGLEADLATNLNNLAVLYKSQGRYSEAEPLYLQALELRKRLLGEDHPDVATSLNNLAVLYNSQGRYSESETLFLQALELRKRLLGEDHPYVATSLNNLASVYNKQGRYSEAEALLLQALELRKRLVGEDHPDVATSLNNLAVLYNSQGRYSESETLFLQALELRKRLLGEDHPDVATSLNNLAVLYKSQGRYSEAEPLFLQALELAERVLGVNHPNTVIFRKNLASLQAKMVET